MQAQNGKESVETCANRDVELAAVKSGLEHVQDMEPCIIAHSHRSNQTNTNDAEKPSKNSYTLLYIGKQDSQSLS